MFERFLSLLLLYSVAVDHRARIEWSTLLLSAWLSGVDLTQEEIDLFLKRHTLTVLPRLVGFSPHITSYAEVVLTNGDVVKCDTIEDVRKHSGVHQVTFRTVQLCVTFEIGGPTIHDTVLHTCYPDQVMQQEVHVYKHHIWILFLRPEDDTSTDELKNLESLYENIMDEGIENIAGKDQDVPLMQNTFRICVDENGILDVMKTLHFFN